MQGLECAPFSSLGPMSGITTVDSMESCSDGQGTAQLFSKSMYCFAFSFENESPCWQHLFDDVILVVFDHPDRSAFYFEMSFHEESEEIFFQVFIYHLHRLRVWGLF